jgi:plasmid stabilization system protein ParE
MEVCFDEYAITEFDAITKYYARINRGLAARLIEELDEKVQLLAGNPRLGESVEDGYRRFPLLSFPYTVIYKIDASKNVITIAALSHQRRRPDYWHDRIQEESAVYQLAA